MGVQGGDLFPKMDKIISDLSKIVKNTNESGCCPATTSAGNNTSIPAGFSSISIVALTPTVTVTMTDGSTFDMTVANETLVQVASGHKSLPAYAISGGSWKWVGIK